jgi:hypothetical protein
MEVEFDVANQKQILYLEQKIKLSFLKIPRRIKWCFFKDTVTVKPMHLLSYTRNSSIYNTFIWQMDLI